VVLEPPIPAGDDEVGLLQDPEVFHHSEPRHAEALFELVERQSAPVAQGVEQLASRRVAQRLEDGIHGSEDR